MKLVPHTLRWRLQIWYGILLVVVLCSFGFTAHHLEKVERLRNMDNELRQRLAMLVTELRAPSQRESGKPPRAPDPGGRPGPNLTFAPEVAAQFGEGKKFYYVVWLRGDEPIASSVNVPPNVPRPKSGDAATREREGQLRETFLFAAPVDCVLVGRSVADEKMAMFFNAVFLAGAGAVLLVLGLIGGGWLIARAIRPIGDIAATAARIARGDLTQRIHADNDDSELGQLSKTLNATFAQLESAFAQQQRFTADAAHELRTPLTVLLTQMQASLARERKAEEYRDTLEGCQRAAQRMRKLLEALLQLARLDAGEEPVKREPFDLADVARGCTDFMTPLAGEQGVELKIEAVPAQINCDSDRIEQVITNLLTNAIQHTPKGGTIMLRVSKNELGACIEISDTGKGIEPNDLPHIFERFYRADSARTSTAGRTGLGLPIAKAIVDAHGGSITAKSEAGKGTTITMLLPLR